MCVFDFPSPENHSRETGPLSCFTDIRKDSAEVFYPFGAQVRGTQGEGAIREQEEIPQVSLQSQVIYPLCSIVNLEIGSR